MAKNKIQRIDQEIARVREKIAEYQDKLKTWKRRKPRQRTWRSSRWCAPAADPGAAERHALRRSGSRHGRCLY